MTFEIGMYSPEDFDKIKPHKIYDDCREVLKKQADAIKYMEGSHVISFYYNGKVEAVIGLVLNWDGYATVWTYASDKMKEFPISFIKTLKRVLDSYENGLKLHRIEAHTPAKFHEGSRLLELLGFKKEGLMIKFGPRKDSYWLYARTR